MSYSIASEFVPLNELAPFVWTGPNVLHSNECKTLIELAKSHLEESKVLGKHMDGYRTSSTAWIYEHHHPALIQKMEEWVQQLTNLPLENQEYIQVVRYEVGQEFKRHQDFWLPDTDHYEDQMAKGGQRVFTVMFYLNDNFEGGETYFDKIDLTVKPETGKALIWQNITHNKRNTDASHAGKPVTAGEKWAAVIWVREGDFRGPHGR